MPNQYTIASDHTTRSGFRGHSNKLKFGSVLKSKITLPEYYYTINVYKEHIYIHYLAVVYIGKKN